MTTVIVTPPNELPLPDDSAIEQQEHEPSIVVAESRIDVDIADSGSAIIQVSMPHPRHPNRIVVVKYDGGNCPCATAHPNCHCWAPRKIAPNGANLQFCPWHSGRDPRASRSDPPEKATYTERPAQYGYWTRDFNCYDLCWLEEAKMREQSFADMRRLEKTLSQTDAEYERVMAVVEAFNNSVAQCDELKGRVEALQASIKAKRRPRVTDSTRSALENIVKQDTKVLEAKTAEGVTRWEKVVSERSAEGLPTDESAKLRFLRDLHFVADAQNKLDKSKERLQNYINKLGGDKQAQETMQRDEELRNMTTQLAITCGNLPTAARAPFFELYTAVQQLRDLPFSGSHRFRHLESRLAQARKHEAVYKAELVKLTKYIPRNDFQKVYAQIVEEKAKAARVMADVAAATSATVTKVGTGSVLGQLYLDEHGNIITAPQMSGPAMIVKAEVTAVKPSMESGSTEIRSARREHHDTSEEDREYADYDQYYEDSKADRSQNWRKVATRPQISRQRRR